jgi:hypothetical protein
MRSDAISLLVALTVPIAAQAQDIPPYVPANPLLASRSALYAQPYIAPHQGWQLRWIADYYNAVEVAQSPDVRQTIFDAEVLQGDIWATRDLSHYLFVVADLPVRGGYNGVLDDFLNWYHHVIGLGVPARDELPIDVFNWTFQLPDTTVTRPRPGTFIGDFRGGIGVRAGRTQFVATVTLPTGTTPQDGWTRHVVGTSLAATSELVRTPRLQLDAGASVGFTPEHGALARYQRSAFLGGFASTRWRFAGQQAVFGTIWGQTSNWHGTGFSAVDDAEVTLDFGFLLHVRPRWPELQLGMTQDLLPRGPAMDVGFTMGLRW